MDKRFPAEVEVKKGYSWSDQLGIAIAALVEASQEDLVKWAQEVSVVPFGQMLVMVEFFCAYSL